MTDDEKSEPEKYIGYINANILTLIDYDKLYDSYETDMVYAKGVLNHLHQAMIEVYGSERLTEEDGDDEGFVLVPGLLRGMASGRICLALFNLDLEGSGELWGTFFLCEAGVVSQDSETNTGKAVRSRYIPYAYCYTADIPCDHHVKKDLLPDELKAVFKDFRNHSTELSDSDEAQYEREEGNYDGEI
jgi:hypothetical protein